MWQLIVKGGWVMAPIIAGSIVGLTVIIEKIIVFALAGKDASDFVRLVFKSLKSGQISKALELCDKNKNLPVSAVFRVGVERCDLAADKLEKVIEQAGNNQVQKLEKHLGVLATIISIEPLLGFLGTIVGLISAFMAWEKAGADVTVNALAGGIYQAMITTAAGLIVAIPLAIFYNYFISRIKYISNEISNYSLQLMEMFCESK